MTTPTKSNATPREEMEFVLAEWIVQSTPLPDTDVPESFLVRARKAAGEAESLRKLEDATRHLEGELVPLPEYLGTAARLAKVNLERTLETVEGQPSPISPWIRLAKSIGVASERIKLLTRLWFAENELEMKQFSPVLARGKNGDSVTKRKRHFGPDEAAAARALTTLEANYAPETKAVLEACFAEIDT